MLSRAKLILALFAVAGVATLLIHPRRYEDKKEVWMEATIPERLPGYVLIRSSRSDPWAKKNEAYKLQMKVLQPFGIVSRIYKEEGPDGRTFDFTVIAGNTRRPFHDPKVCFTAQDWELEEPRLRYVNIPAMGGKVPATVMGLHGSSSRAITMYFYKGPMGLRHDSFYIPFDLTFAKLMLRDDVDAQYFRVMVYPATGPAGESPQRVEQAMKADIADMERFANVALSELAKAEGGDYFIASR